MISTIYWIKDNILNKQLGIMARPRGNDWLEDEIKWLNVRKVDTLVSLLEKSEEWALGLDKEQEYCSSYGIDFISFPIKDVTTPKNEQAFLKLVDQLAKQIQQNKKVVIHCRMGIGRSSTLAASVMIKLGSNSDAIFEMISQSRGLKVPDTQEQKNWVLSLTEKLKR